MTPSVLKNGEGQADTPIRADRALFPDELGNVIRERGSRKG